jgi:hypothetical protein
MSYGVYTVIKGAKIEIKLRVKIITLPVTTSRFEKYLRRSID